MPNPPRPSQNSRPFNPDKGLPLIGQRDQRKTGQGAAKKAEEDYQMYGDNGERVVLETMPSESKDRKRFTRKGK